MKMRLKTYKMATSILLKFLTLNCDISRTLWLIEVSDGSLFCIFHTLSFELSLFFDRTCPFQPIYLNLSELNIKFLIKRSRSAAGKLIEIKKPPKNLFISPQGNKTSTNSSVRHPLQQRTHWLEWYLVIPQELPGIVHLYKNSPTDQRYPVQRSRHIASLSKAVDQDRNSNGWLHKKFGML